MVEGKFLTVVYGLDGGGGFCGDGFKMPFL